MWSLVRNRRLWFGALVVGALVALAMWPTSTPVETAAVTSGPMVVTIDEDGRTRVRDRFVVASPVTGEVLRIDLEPGDAVKKGQRVATVRPAAPVPLDARTRAEAEASVQAAEAARGRLPAERARADTALALANRELARVKSLAAGGAVAAEEVERRQADADAAAAAVRAAEAATAQGAREVDVARARIAPGRPTGARDVVVTAPVDGVILTRHRESESVVPAGDPLVEIGDPSKLEIVADLLSSDAVKVRPGSRVIVDQWGGDAPLAAHVRLVEPAGFTKVSALGVEEQRVNVIMDFDALPEAARRLGDGYRVEVRVVTWEAASVIKVPSGALFRSGESWAVYIVQDGRAHVRVVTIGERNANEAEVRAGLAAGDVVILYPPDTLADAARVTARTP
jgi:HlyD family secretion protein